MTDLLSILYGGGSSTGSTQSAYNYYQMLQQNGDKQYQEFTKSAKVQQEVEYFQEQINKIETPEDFMKDQRLVKFALSAFTMDDEAQYMGRLNKIMLEDPADEDSLVNKMSDRRFTEIAEFFQFDSRGLDRIKLKGNQLELIEKYYVNEWEKSLGEVNPALREAAYFARNVNDVNNVYNLLSDQVLAKVTRETVGLPDQIVYQTIERQAIEFEKRVEIEELSLNSEDEFDFSKQQREKATNDLDKLSDQLFKTQTIESDMSRIESKMQALQEDFEYVDSLSTATGELADKIAYQTDNIDEWVDAENMISTTSSAIEQINIKMQKIQEYMDQTNDSNLETNKTRINNLYTEIEDIVSSTSYRRSSDGAEVNVFDPAHSISVGTDSASDPTIIQGVDASTLLDRIGQAKDAYNSASSASDLNNLQQANARMANAQIDFATLEGSASNRRSSLDTALNGIDNMVATVDTDVINDARVAVSDALLRSQDVINIANDLRDVALESVGFDGDRTELNTKYETLRQELFDLIATPVSGSTNLLASNGLQGFEYKTGASVWVEGTDLATELDSLFPASLVEGEEAQILNGIDSAKTIANQTITDYSEQLDGITRLATEFDPRGAVKNQAQELQAEAAALLAPKTDEEGNETLSPYDPSAIDRNITLETNGYRVTVHSVSNFQNDVLDKLSSAASNLLTDSTQALADLKAALYATQDIAAQTRSDARTIRTQTSAVEQIKADNTPEVPENSEYSLLNFNTKYTQEFIERYLITKDSAGQQSQLSGSGSGILSLLA